MLGVQLDEIVELAPPHRAGRDACPAPTERGGEARRRDCGHRGGGGEVELDPFVAAVGREQPALGVEAGLPARREATLLPQDVCARERRMTAQRDLDGGGEPAEPVALVFGIEERRLGEVHFARHVLHPALILGDGKNAHGGGVARERAARERVHLHDPQTHVPNLACFRRAATAHGRGGRASRRPGGSRSRSGPRGRERRRRRYRRRSRAT